jgi:hypothetical protein
VCQYLCHDTYTIATYKYSSTVLALRQRNVLHHRPPSSLPFWGLEGPERDLFIKEVTGTDLVRDQNTQNGAKASIFKGTLGNRNIWLVDCPSMSVTDKEFLEAVKTAILKDYTGSKGAVDGVVYFHDITETNVKEQAARNLALVCQTSEAGSGQCDDRDHTVGSQSYK